MNILIPTTLKARAILILCGIFVASHAASLLIYEANRDETIVFTEAADLAARIIGIVTLADSFPAKDRQQILAAAETQFLATFPELVPVEQVACQENTFSKQITQHIEAAFTKLPSYQVNVCLRDLEALPLFLSAGFHSGFDARIVIEFPDGEKTLFHAVLPDNSSLFQEGVLIYLLVITVLALMLAWYLIHKAVAPLGRLANAAEEIGVNLDAPPLHEGGPKEVVAAAKAFNRMQSRLQRLVHGQTEMIGAISHDLKSAVTRLQLRGELLSDKKERRGLLQVIEDMKLMVQSVIDFVRGYDPNEQARKLNITALIESLCEDLKDEGFPVSYLTDTQTHVLLCRPAALRRGIHNIIDNAIKYGGSAHVTLAATPQSLHISVDDTGPGIPQDQLDRVIKPFYRLDRSRNSETGGIGLGLAITQNIVHAHGGTFRLTNLKQGGLRAEIQLPAGNTLENKVKS